MLSAAFAPNSLAAMVKMSGLTSFVNAAINPHRPTVENSTGHTLEILGNATGKGLVDPSGAMSDSALSSEPLDIAIATAGIAGKKIDAAAFRLHEM